MGDYFFYSIVDKNLAKKYNYQKKFQVRFKELRKYDLLLTTKEYPGSLESLKWIVRQITKEDLSEDTVFTCEKINKDFWLCKL